MNLKFVFPVFILLLLVVALIPHPMHENTVTIKLIVQHYRNGKLIGTYVKDGDIFTRNIVNIWQGLLASQSPNVNYKITLTDNSNVQFQAYVAYCENTASKCFIYPNNVKIAIGTGTAAPSINDYALGAQVASATPSTSESTTSTSGYWQLTASFSFTQSYSISEFGIYQDFNDYGGATHTVLLNRDVLSTPISVVSGDSLTVTYQIRVNS
jgi:hypothetical protein